MREDFRGVVPSPVLHRLVELACLAPSVHNTQPWLWEASSGRIRLYADRGRMLRHEDPLGRNLLISCGAALDHLRVAAGALRLSADIVRLPEGPDRDLLGEVHLRRGAPSATAADDIATLRERCTDRRRFTSWPVPSHALERLVERAHARGAQAMAVVDPSTRFHLELLTHRAGLAQARDRAAMREQHAWVRDRPDDGVPRAVLPDHPGPVSPRFGTGTAPDPRQIVEASDGMLVLGGDADAPLDWLRTGEALSSLWLRATRDGLSVVPLSLPTEVDSVREDLRESGMSGVVVPHLLIRVGWQAIGRSQLPRTPRRPVDEVLLG